ncbi:MAG TPA: hypothetical protein VFW28_08085 [Micropepsaceae bacterium]|nr:hypothetical protein [Micropepsaceae bacterium]
MKDTAEIRQTAVVNGRQCGTCTVCCKIPPIHTKELRKTANLLCRHCDEGRGCRIYETRPAVCRGFYCEWLLNPRIPATWRPERSGIFIERIAREHIEAIPDGYVADYVLSVMLFRSDAVERPALGEIIADYIAGRVATFLTIPGPAGHLPAQMFLNEFLESAVAKRDFTEMMVTLRQALATLSRQEFERVPDFD